MSTAGTSTPPSRESSRVVLFDIDGTLIATNGAGRVALERALLHAFQISESVSVPTSGRTDRQIAGDMFRAFGLADSSENWERLQQAYLRELPDALQAVGGEILPGVESLLARLCEGEAQLGLLTGNMRHAAQMKLRHFGLHRHFTFGGFGERHQDRDHVARDAMQALAKRLGGPSRQPVWVVGDTPLDIRCARAVGASVAAVATGTFSRDELAAASPDVLLDDLNDTDRLVGLLLGEAP